MITSKNNISALSQISMQCLQNHFRLHEPQLRSSSIISSLGSNLDQLGDLAQDIWREIYSAASTGAEGITIAIGAFGWTSHSLRSELQDIYPGQACLCMTYPNHELPLAALNIYIKELTLADYKNDAHMVNDGIISMIDDIYNFLRRKFSNKDVICLVSNDFISIRWIPSDFDADSMNIEKTIEALRCGVPYEDVFAEYELV